MAKISSLSWRRIRLTGYLLFAIYLVTLAWASFNPEPIDGSGPIRQFVAWVLNFTSIDPNLKWLDYNRLESLANILLYVPLGLGLALIFKRLPWWADILLGVTVTLTAEGVQRWLLPDRFATWADVLNNSIGVAIGVISARSIVALVRLRRAQGSASPVE